MAKCRVPGCAREVSDTLLMCWPHWKRVPFKLQNQVVQHFQYDRTRKQRGSSLEYLASVKLAIESVVQWEGKHEVKDKQGGLVGGSSDGDVRSGDDSGGAVHLRGIGL